MFFLFYLFHFSKRCSVASSVFADHSIFQTPALPSLDHPGAPLKNMAIPITLTVLTSLLTSDRSAATLSPLTSKLPSTTDLLFGSLKACNEFQGFHQGPFAGVPSPTGGYQCPTFYLVLVPPVPFSHLNGQRSGAL